MRELDLDAAARRIEAHAPPRLHRAGRRDPRIGEVRGRGAMLAIELVQPGTLEPGPGCATAAVARACHAAGLLMLTCGTYGNVLRFLPPLVISDDELPAAWTSSAASLLAQLPG